jgi:hypothetical protein
MIRAELKATVLREAEPVVFEQSEGIGGSESAVFFEGHPVHRMEELENAEEGVNNERGDG